MKISVILGHPYRESFNCAIAETAANSLTQNGHEVFYHDLYSEGFDPIMKPGELVGYDSDDRLVKQHQDEIVEVDGIVIVHPNWWGQAPAILKGWVDRVLRENVAYKFEEGESGSGLPIGLLKAQTGIVFNTSNTSAEREADVFGDPLERIWRDCIFGFCGVRNFERRMFRIVADSTDAARANWLKETEQVVQNAFPRP